MHAQEVKEFRFSTRNWEGAGIRKRARHDLQIADLKISQFSVEKSNIASPKNCFCCLVRTPPLTCLIQIRLCYKYVSKPFASATCRAAIERLCLVADFCGSNHTSHLEPGLASKTKPSLKNTSQTEGLNCQDVPLQILT